MKEVAGGEMSQRISTSRSQTRMYVRANRSCTRGRRWGRSRKEVQEDVAPKSLLGGRSKSKQEASNRATSRRYLGEH